MLLALLLAACASDSDGNRNVPPTRIPVTITPRPTPLPDAPQASDLRDASRAIEVMFATDATTNARRITADLQNQLETDLEMEIRVEVTTENMALQALCGGAPRAAWVSAFTYALAAQNCDVVPALAVMRGRIPNLVWGQTAEIIGRAELDDLNALDGRAFCRSLDQDYFTGWVIPSLFLAAEGVNPLTDLSGALDYPDDLAMVRGLYGGACAAGVIATSELDNLLIELADEVRASETPVTPGDLAELINVLQQAGDPTIKGSDNVIPYEVLVFAPDSVLPANTRAQIIGSIVDFFDDATEGTGRLNGLLGATGIVEVEASDYSAFRALMSDAGWNMAFNE